MADPGEEDSDMSENVVTPVLAVLCLSSRKGGMS